MIAVATTAWIMSGLAIALYEALIYLPLLQGYKWSLLIVELAIAAAGLLVSLVGLWRRRWNCAVCFAICGCVLYKQLIA